MEEIRDNIVQAANDVNERYSNNYEMNRIKYAKFRGMVKMYELCTGEDVDYIKSHDKVNNRFVIKEIMFKDEEFVL